MDVKKVSWFTYATWNIRGLGEKDEELDKILKENNIKISVITESKKKVQGMKETTLYGYIQWSRRTHQRPVRSYETDPQANIK
jgi:hypothetical protein